VWPFAIDYWISICCILASSRPVWFGPGEDVNSVESNKIFFGDIAVVSYASFLLVVSECVLSPDPAQCGKPTALDIALDMPFFFESAYLLCSLEVTYLKILLRLVSGILVQYDCLEMQLKGGRK